MPADTPVSALVDETPYEAGSVIDPMSRVQRVVRMVGGLLVGVVAVLLGLMVLTDVNAGYRVVLVCGGLVLLFVGLDNAGKLARGPQFETGLWLSVIWVVVIGLAAAFADFLPLSEAKDASVTLVDKTENLLRPDLLSDHPLGTDRQALDVLGGIVFGARVSLQVSLLAVAIGILVGGTIGVVAGFFRGKLDSGIGVLTDSMLAFPPLILLLALASALERSPRNMAIALAILGIPTYIRLSRVNTMVFAEREFVLASRAMGSTRGRIMFRELVPNVALPIFSYAFIIIAVLIVAEASLSFLGLGIQRPNPTWGNMIAAGQTDFDRHPHLVFAPGIVMFMTVFALNRVGEKAREIWDPRQAKL